LEYDTYVASRIPSLRRSAYLLCGDWDRGDDLVQKVLTQLYMVWSRASRIDNMDAYVRAMLVRRFLDDRRSGWARRVTLTDSSVTPEPTAAAEPDPTVRLDVRAALASLPPRQRAVAVLRYLHDMSVEQTADALGCTTGTVKSQTAKALAALRRHLSTESMSARSEERAPQLARGPRPNRQNGAGDDRD
jgi:RNA polymerase sigma-70 factor (sigma-E family)